MNALTRHYLDDISVLMTEEHEADDPMQIDQLLTTALAKSRRLSVILEKLIENNRLGAGER